MCGICGIVTKHKSRAWDGLLDAMNQQIVHRGPDDDGAMSFPRAILAMRRLSIIDLAGGHQPLGNADGTLSIVFNAEIYNYRELRRELLKPGHRFATQSDTEVIVHGFEEWCVDCVNRF